MSENIKQKCETQIKNSKVIRGISAASDFLGKTFSKGITAEFLKTPEKHEVLSQSLFARAVNGVFLAFGSLFSKRNEKRRSVLKGIREGILEYALLTNLYDLGVFVLYIFGGFLILLGGQENIADALKKSKTVLYLARYSENTEIIFEKATALEKRNELFFGKSIFRRLLFAVLIVGAIVALGGMNLTIPAAIAVIAAIGMVVLALFPILGVFMAVFFAPFLPTMVLAGIILYTFFCYVLNLLDGEKIPFSLDMTGAFVLLFAIVLLFAAITSFARAESIKIALLMILFLCSYFLVVTFMKNKRNLRTLIFLFCTSSLFTGLYGLYQRLTGLSDTTWTDTGLFEGVSLRVYSTFGNPNVFAEYLLLAIPVSLFMVWGTKKKIPKCYYAGISVVLIANLALTYSRGCYLAILVSLFVFLCFAGRKFIVVALAGVLASPLFLPQSIISRFTSILNFSDTSTSYRLQIWEGSLAMLKDYFVSGIGLGEGAFQMIYPLYSLNGIVAPHTHNLFLQLLSDTGIAGFLVFFILIAFFLKKVLSTFGNTSFQKDKVFLVVLMSAVVGFLFEGLFEYVWYNYRVFLLFFIVISIASAGCNLVRKGENLFD